MGTQSPSTHSGYVNVLEMLNLLKVLVLIVGITTGHGAECDASNQCLDGMTCSPVSRKCECPAGQTYNGNMGKCVTAGKSMIGDTCYTLSDCNIEVPNSVHCVDEICTCKSGYVKNKYSCRLPQLNEKCQVLPGCGSNLTESKQVQEICSGGICNCPDGSEQFTIRDVKRTICLRVCSLTPDGERCEAHNECTSQLCRQAHPGDTERTCIPWKDKPRTNAASTTSGVISSFSVVVIALAALRYTY